MTAQVYLESQAGSPTIPSQAVASYQATLSGTLAPGQESSLNVAVNSMVANVLKWTAESPNLYRVLVTLWSSSGSVISSRPIVVGFRTVEMKNAALLVNGMPVTIRGVNRHEHHPELGRAVPLETMKQDIALLIQNNLNSVRTAHYPNSPKWYAIMQIKMKKKQINIP